MRRLGNAPTLFDVVERVHRPPKRMPSRSMVMAGDEEGPSPLAPALPSLLITAVVPLEPRSQALLLLNSTWLVLRGIQLYVDVTTGWLCAPAEDTLRRYAPIFLATVRL